MGTLHLTKMVEHLDIARRQWNQRYGGLWDYLEQVASLLLAEGVRIYLSL